MKKCLESSIVDVVKKFNEKWKDSIHKGLPCDYHGLSCDIRKIIKHSK